MKRVSEILMAVLFSVTLFGLMIATILLPKQQYSYYENRNLSEFPEISPETILSGKVFSDLETMFCDYAAGRTQMLKASTWCDLHLFHRGAGGGLYQGTSGHCGIKGEQHHEN